MTFVCRRCGLACGSLTRRGSKGQTYQTAYCAACHAKTRRAWEARHPERRRAQQLLQRAVRRGLIKRGVCEVCGSARAEAHHEDYSAPLEVRWLCRLHHFRLHAEKRREART